MAKQRIKKVQVSAKLEEAFPRFVASATARGVSDKTIQTYHEHIHRVGKHIELSMTFLDLILVKMGNARCISAGRFSAEPFSNGG